MKAFQPAALNVLCLGNNYRLSMLHIDVTSKTHVPDISLFFFATGIFLECTGRPVKLNEIWNEICVRERKSK